jgi:hypothetical protein
MKRSIEFRFEQKIKHGELDNVTISTESGEEILYSNIDKDEKKIRKVRKNKRKENLIDDEYELI